MTTITNEITTGIRERVDDLPWSDLRKQLDGNGYAVTSMLLSGEECDELSDLFDEGRFRSTGACQAR